MLKYLMQLINQEDYHYEAHTKAYIELRSRDLPEIKRYRTPKSLIQANFSSPFTKLSTHF